MNSTAKNLRVNTKEILENVKRGGEVIITFHGKPYAKIVPIEDRKKTKDKCNELFGLWKDRSDLDNVSSYIRKIRRGRFYDND
jgi:prevent-host-death family protein